MKQKKHFFIILFASAMVVAVGGSGYFLVKGRAVYAKAKVSLQQEIEQYKSLTSKQPYPSRENLEELKQNLEKVQDFSLDLRKKLNQNQGLSETIQVAQFPERLEDTFDFLKKKAKDGNVFIPEHFFYGFKAYQQGSLPLQEDLPQLMVQLNMTRGLCELLFNQKISQLTTIERDTFDQGQGPEMMGLGAGGLMAGGGLTGAVDSPVSQSRKSATPFKRKGELYQKERFTVGFVAKDEHVWAVFNELVGGSLFAVIRGVNLTNIPADPSGKAQSHAINPRGGAPMLNPGMMMGFDPLFGGPMMPGMGGFNPGATMGYGSDNNSEEVQNLYLVPHEERTIAGRGELVQVRLDLDLYWFRMEEEEPAGNVPVTGKAGKVKPRDKRQGKGAGA